jgi:hypothetical protein
MSKSNSGECCEERKSVVKPSGGIFLAINTGRGLANLWLGPRFPHWLLVRYRGRGIAQEHKEDGESRTLNSWDLVTRFFGGFV